MSSYAIASRTYRSGEAVIDIPQNRIDKQFDGYKVTLSRENWPAGVDCKLDDGTVQKDVAVQVVFERSADAGATWVPAGGATFPGGVVLDRKGQSITESYISFSAQHPLTSNVVRQQGMLRVRVKNLVAVKTAVTIDVQEPA